jgi:phytoene dehydrogenase-like protein
MGETDAVVVGAGPNGLVAAVTLARAGWRVVVMEAGPTPGGGTRTSALTNPGFLHDVCSAIHPLALASPAFAALPLADHGVKWIQPDAPLAHVLDGGRAAFLERSIDETADRLGPDAKSYRSLYSPLVKHGRPIVESMLSPLSIPRRPLTLPRFGLNAIRSADGLARSRFSTDEARALLVGMASHALHPDAAGTAGYGLFMGLLAHLVGWPLPEGGSQRIADALVAILQEHGGEVLTGTEVTSLAELPSARAVLLDVTPRQFLRLAGDTLPSRYERALQRYRYGSGAFKVDWALDGPVPWTVPEVARAATVHVGGTIDEIDAGEQAVNAGRHAERPLVILAQPSDFDPTRAPEGKQAVWGYCHVPNGSDVDQTEAIERQIERFAPGFRDRIIGRHTISPTELQTYNANDVGGDINGGAGDLRQLVTRPVASLHPWKTPLPGVYLCSSSTPPGGGVHGMCGWHAAQEALRRERHGVRWSGASTRPA